MVTILQIQLTILIIIATGYFITKKGIFSAKARADMTNIVIYLVLPCNIVNSFGKNVTINELKQCVVVLAAAFGMQLLYIVLNKFLYLRLAPKRQVVAKYGTICNNAGFLGLPVIEAVFGQTGVLYGAIVLIPIRIFMWTAGLSLFTATETREKIKTLTTHPCIWAVILGFAYTFAPFELPAFVTGALSALGGCTTALSMLVVGSILSDINPKSVLDKDCFYYSFIRLIAIPAVVFGVLALLKVDPLVTGVAVLSSAMPAPTVAAMLAEKYGQDASFASKNLFVSTALSVVTLPLIAAVLTQFLTN